MIKLIKQNRHDKLGPLISYFAIGSLVFLAIGLKNIDNYIDWLLFSITMSISGLLFGTFLYVVLGIIFPDTKNNSNSQRIGIFAQLAFGFSLTFFGIGSLLNESSILKKDCKEYIIDDIGSSASRQRVYYIVVDYDNKRERLSFGKAFNENHKTGDKVKLCIITGRLGFKYFKINTNT